MSLQNLYTRIKFHSLRFKTEIIVGAVIIASMSMLMGTAFPDDPDFIANYVDVISAAGLDALLGTIDVNAPGWLFWLSLMMGIYLYYTFAIVGVRIGSRLFPTKNEDALELLSASNPQAPRRFYIETYTSGLISVAILVSISYLFLIFYSLMNDAADVILRLGIVHLFYYAIAVFVMTIASSASIFGFNKGTGDKVGYLYLVFSFFLELTSNTGVDERILNLSMNRYLSPMSGILTSEWNWQAFFVVVGLILTIVGVTNWYVKRPEYIERISPIKTEGERLSFIPQFSPKREIAQKHPILFEELRTDRNLFLIWGSIVAFFIFYIVYLFSSSFKDNPAEISEMLKSFDMPILKAFTHGHSIRYDYIGFLSYEFYGIWWMYFGLMLIFPSIGASNRDYSNDVQDIIYANAVRPREVIKSRTWAIQIQFFTVYTFCHMFLIAIQEFSGITGELSNQISVYLVGVIFGIGFGLFFQGFTMLFSIEKGRKYALYLFFASLFFLITGFVSSDLQFVKYFSVLYYYDAVGLLYGDMLLLDGVLRAGAFTIFSVMLYFIGLERFSRGNLS